MGQQSYMGSPMRLNCGFRGTVISHNQLPNSELGEVLNEQLKKKPDPLLQCPFIIFSPENLADPVQ